MSNLKDAKALIKKYNKIFKQSDEVGLTLQEALNLAIEFNNIEIIEDLEASGIDVEHAIIEESYTIMHYCAQKGKRDMLKKLVVKGYDVNILSENGMTPLECAIFAGQEEIIEYLETHGAKKDLVSVETVIKDNELTENNEVIILSVIKCYEVIEDIMVNLRGFISGTSMKVEDTAPGQVVEENYLDRILNMMILNYKEQLKDEKESIKSITVEDYQQALFEINPNKNHPTAKKMINRFKMITSIMDEIIFILNKLKQYNADAHKYTKKDMDKLAVKYDRLLTKLDMKK